jgi:hypothetical protein
VHTGEHGAGHVGDKKETAAGEAAVSTSGRRDSLGRCEAEDPTSRPAWQAFPALAAAFKTGRREVDRLLERQRFARANLRAPAELPPDRAHAALEVGTWPFRVHLAMQHQKKARAARRAYHDMLGVWEDAAEGWTEGTDLPADADIDEATRSFASFTELVSEAAKSEVSTEKWHSSRMHGQLTRFERVRGCGGRVMIASCKACGEDRKPIRESCDVRRVCKSCEVDGAKARRARFGRARGRKLIDADRYALFQHNRAGGRYGEKMLTLTVPHWDLEDATGKIAEEAKDTIHARILALFKAWPELSRKLGKFWKARFEVHVAYHRSFEWTSGTDHKGHPHFHVYLFSPFVDLDVVREWWALALRRVGWPVLEDEVRPGVFRSRVMVHVKGLPGWNLNAVRELMKGGKRSAIELSKVGETGAGADAFSYADGWTMADVSEADDVRAKLYMALEGRRLTQASRGFFVDDEPPECQCCGGRAFRVRFEAKCRAADVPPINVITYERGPPS